MRHEVIVTSCIRNYKGHHSCNVLPMSTFHKDNLPLFPPTERLREWNGHSEHMPWGPPEMLLLDQAGPAWGGSVTRGTGVGLQEHGGLLLKRPALGPRGRGTAFFRECSVVRAPGRHRGEMTCRGVVTLHPSLGTASQKGPSRVSARAPQGWSDCDFSGKSRRTAMGRKGLGLPARMPAAKASREVDAQSPASQVSSPQRAPWPSSPSTGHSLGLLGTAPLFPVRTLCLPNYSGSSERAAGPITACPLDLAAELTTGAWPWGDGLNQDARVLLSGPLTGPPPFHQL